MTLDDGPVPLEDTVEVGKIGVVGGDEGDTLIFGFGLVLQSLVTVDRFGLVDLWCDILVVVSAFLELRFEFTGSVSERVLVRAYAAESEGETIWDILGYMTGMAAGRLKVKMLICRLGV